MLQVKDLTKTYRSQSGDVTAVSKVNLEVKDGVFASIIGKSGSGKSTLLALLGALDKPSSGSIIVGDKDITRLGDSGLTEYRRDSIGFVFQAYNLVPNLTALENVMLPLELAKVPRAQQISRAEMLLTRVGIEGDKQKRKPTRLSGGEQQRVAIARALANSPKLILADEPTGNLDSQTGKLIVDLLHDLARTEKTTIIAVTHDMEVAHQATKIFKLSDGKLVEHKKK
jgi:putative ABC transport system ATP-binding protein